MADVIADAHNLPFRDSVFDDVLIYSALEHFKNPKHVLDEAYRVADIGGTLTVTVVNGNHWPMALTRSSPEHYYTWDIWTLQTLIESAGWHVKNAFHFTFTKRKKTSKKVRLVEWMFKYLYGSRATPLFHDSIRVEAEKCLVK